MKSIKMLVLATLLFVLVFGANCGKKDKFTMAKDLISKQVLMMEVYVTALEKAGNAQDVAKAIDAFSAEQKNLIPAMKELTQKFPELKDQAEPPVELKPELDKLQQVMGRLIQSTIKISQYMQDPEVMAAQKKYQEVQAEMK